MRSASRFLIGLVLVAGAASGCGSQPDASPATQPAASTPTQSVAPSSTSAASGPTCDPQQLTAVLDSLVPDDTVPLTSVTVDACRDGFVQLVAVRDQSGCPPSGTAGNPCTEPQRMWLKYADGAWTVLDVGTGIGCDPTDLAPSITEACAALYPATEPTDPLYRP